MRSSPSLTQSEDTLTPITNFNNNLVVTQTVSSSSSSPPPYSIMAPTKVMKVLVPIANGMEPMQTVIIVDVLRRAGARVTIASIEARLRVDALHGIKILADTLLYDLSEEIFDLVAIPGGIPGVHSLKNSSFLESLVKLHAADGRMYAAVCAAPAAVLAPWGLLKGMKAVCHPAFLTKMPSRMIAVKTRVQVDGKVVTSRAPGTTMEFAVALVEQLYDKDKAEEVAYPLVMRHNHEDEYEVNEVNPIKWEFNDVPKVLVPIANGTEEMEALMIIDILRRAKVNVTIASVEDKLVVEASCKVILQADMLLDKALQSSYDLIILPGGVCGACALAKSEKLVSFLKNHVESGRYYGGTCESPVFVLEPHGLLKGKKATAAPAMCDKLSDKSLVVNRIVIDGNLITSRGPGTAMEFTLAILEKLYSREMALELGRSMLVIDF